MNQILVTGGTGIIGSYFKKVFNTTNFTYLGSKDCNLNSISAVREYFSDTNKYDILIFLVGLAHEKGKKSKLSEFNEINFQTLVNILSVFAESNKIPDKIIFASTISIYGERFHQNTYTEDSSKKPLSPYAITKLKAEQYLLKNYFNKSWILRLAPIYSSTFFLNIDRRTKIGSYFFCVGNGSNKLSLCNINNVKSSVENIIIDKVPPNIYNVSDTKYYSYKELLNWQSSSFTLWVPKILVKILYYYGKIFRNIFLQENTVKLLSDNIYPNNKISAFIELPFTLNNINRNRRVNS